MFQNTQLASYVNQLGLQQQKQLQNQQSRSKSRPKTGGGLNNVPCECGPISLSPKKQPSLMVGLPRQSVLERDRKTLDYINNGNNSNGGGKDLQLMALGNRLSMQTYTKKESDNPQKVVPGFPGALQKALKARQQTAKEKIAQLKLQVENEKKQQIMQNLQTAQGQRRISIYESKDNKKMRRQSLNTDLVSVGKQKPGNLCGARHSIRGGRLASSSKDNTPVNSARSEIKKSNNLASKRTSKQENSDSLPRTPSLYKGDGEVEDKQSQPDQGNVLTQPSQLEALEDGGYLPMNIQVKTSQQIVDNEFKYEQQQNMEQTNNHFQNQRSIHVLNGNNDQHQIHILGGNQSHHQDVLQDFYADGLLVMNNQAGSKMRLHGHGTTHFTVQKLDDVLKDQIATNQSSLHNEESKEENFANTSIVTQNFVGDYNQHVQQQLSKTSTPGIVKNNISKSSQKTYKKAIRAINANPKERRSMVVKNQSTVSVTGDESSNIEKLKLLNLNNTSPNLRKEKSMKKGIYSDYQKQTSPNLENESRARTTLSDQSLVAKNTIKKTQLVKKVGMSSAGGGVITTLVSGMVADSLDKKLDSPLTANNSNTSGKRHIDLKDVRNINTEFKSVDNCRDDELIDSKGKNQVKSLVGLLLKKNQTSDNQIEAAQIVGLETNDISLLDYDRNQKLVVTFESQELLHGARMTNTVSPTNFSNLERKQQQALLGITGSTLSQHLANQTLQNLSLKMNVKVNKNSTVKWQQKPAQVYHSGEQVYNVNGQGMKGAKVMKNSQFVRMKGYIKRRADDQNNLQSQQALAINQEVNSAGGPIMQLAEDNDNNAAVTNVIRDTFPDKSAIKKINQVRPKTQENKRAVDRIGSGYCDNSQSNLQINIKGVTNKYNEFGMTTDVLQNYATTTHHLQTDFRDLEILGSSIDQNEPMTATMVGTKNNDNGPQTIMGTIQNADLAYGKQSINLNYQYLDHERQKSQSPLDKYIIEKNDTVPQLQVDEFTQSNRRNSGGDIDTHNIIYKNDTFTNQTAKLSNLSNIELEKGGAYYGYEGAESKQMLGVVKGILDIRTEILSMHQDDHEYYNTDTVRKHASQKMHPEAKAAILTFPPPDQQQDNHMLTPHTLATNHMSPQNRTFQKKDGHYRHAKSQNIKKRAIAAEKSDKQMVIGTKFKRKVFFKEADMQNLFERAEQPVQEVIERILLDDLDLLQNFGYAPSSYQKRERAKSAVNFFAQKKNDHLKYEFIEKLLKQPDKDLTSKTLQEMANLYQELLEQRLTVSSYHATAQNLNSLHESIKLDSNQSILISTENKNTTNRFYGGQTNKNEESVLTKRNDSQTKIKTIRGSVQIEPSHFVKNKISGFANTQAASEENTIFLELGRQHWSQNKKKEDSVTSQLVNQTRVATRVASNNEDAFPLMPLMADRHEISIKDQEIILNPQIAMDFPFMDPQDPATTKGSLFLPEKQFVGGGQIVMPQKYQNNNLEIDGEVQQQESKLDQQPNIEAKMQKQQKTRPKKPQAQVLYSHAQQNLSSIMQQSTALQSLLNKERKNKELKRKTQQQQQLQNDDLNQRQEIQHEDVDQSFMIKPSKFQKRRPQNREVHQLRHTNLSPRINAIEDQIKAQFHQQHLMTTLDVHNATNALKTTINTPTNEQLEQRNFLLQLTMARSAYLTYRASKLNQHKVIIGCKEVNDQRKRKEFVENLFHDSIAAKQRSDYNLSNTAHDVTNVENKNLNQDIPVTPTNIKQSIASKRSSQMEVNVNLINVSAAVDTTNQTGSIRSSQPGQLQNKNMFLQPQKSQQSSGRGMSPSPPLVLQEMKHMHTSALSGTKSSLSKSQPNRQNNQKVSQSTERQGYGQIMEPSSVMRYYKKEEASEIENKNVLKHELKVPKAGQLDAVKASRLRQLSSNQVGSFKIRTGNNEFQNGSQLVLQEKVVKEMSTPKESESKSHTRNAKVKSNQDLDGLLKKPHSQHNILEQKFKQVKDDPSSTVKVDNIDLASSADDPEEIGTQLMISRANLTNSHHGSNVNTHAHVVKSPNVLTLFNQEDKKQLNMSSRLELNDIRTNSAEAVEIAKFKTPNTEGQPIIAQRPLKEVKSSETSLKGGVLLQQDQSSSAIKIQDSSQRYQNQVEQAAEHGVELGSSKQLQPMQPQNQKIGTIRVQELYHNKNSVDANEKLVSNSIQYSEEATLVSSTKNLLQGQQPVKIENQQFLTAQPSSRTVMKQNLSKTIMTASQKAGYLRTTNCEKSKSQTANFERLSGLISQQNTQNERKVKLMDHHRRMKEFKRVERVKQDWIKATPGMSHGSTFYKDLQEFRRNTLNQNGEFLDITMIPQSNMTNGFESLRNDISNAEIETENRDSVLQQMMTLNHTKPRPQLKHNLLSRTPKRANRKDTFTISRNAVTPSSKLLISQLLCQVDGHVTDKRTAVSALKQSCLVQYILDEWAYTTKGQLKHFNHFCTYTDTVEIQTTQDPSKTEPQSLQQSKVTTDAYSIILYGKQTPISVCCNQLICFQFAKKFGHNAGHVTLYCLEPSCHKHKLEQRNLNQEIFHTVFLTTKNLKPQSGMNITNRHQLFSHVANKPSSAATLQQRGRGLNRRDIRSNLISNQHHQDKPRLVSSSARHQIQINLRKRVQLASQNRQKLVQQQQKSNSLPSTRPQKIQSHHQSTSSQRESDMTAINLVERMPVEQLSLVGQISHATGGRLDSKITKFDNAAHSNEANHFAQIASLIDNTNLTDYGTNQIILLGEPQARQSGPIHISMLLNNQKDGQLTHIASEVRAGTQLQEHDNKILYNRQQTLFGSAGGSIEKGSYADSDEVSTKVKGRNLQAQSPNHLQQQEAISPLLPNELHMTFQDQNHQLSGDAQ